MRIKRIIRYTLLGLGAILLLAGLLAGTTWLYYHPGVQRMNGFVYGHRLGHDLKFDVIQPANTNGIGVIIMVSGRWKSGEAGSFRHWITAPLLRHGYTVIPVYHLSQPEATIAEITEDVNRAVRFIRHHAREYGVDPMRLGLTGGSAGGHLSLMIATRGGPGAPDAADPVDRESSAVQAVAIFYPVTDLLNLGSSTENLGDGGPPKSFVAGFGPLATNMATWKVLGRDLSPIYFVSSNQPPILIYHGDADTLVPLEQSQRFQTEARKAGATVELVVHHKGQHGWLTMVWDIRRFADWYDRYLRKME